MNEIEHDVSTILIIDQNLTKTKVTPNESPDDRRQIIDPFFDSKQDID
jgi:hypothetical protein